MAFVLTQVVEHATRGASRFVFYAPTRSWGCSRARIARSHAHTATATGSSPITIRGPGSPSVGWGPRPKPRARAAHPRAQLTWPLHAPSLAVSLQHAPKLRSSPSGLGQGHKPYSIRYCM